MGDEAEGQEEAPALPPVSVDELIAAVRGQEAKTVTEMLPAVADLNALSIDGENALVACAAVGRQQLLGKLLKAGASADGQNSTGLSALGSASMNGYLPCVKQLLSGGATVDLACGRQKATALMYAAQNGHRAVCDALLTAGADPMRPDAYGVSAEEAAHRFETTGRVQAWDFKLWARNIEVRAQAIEAEPPPSPPPYPRNLAKDVEAWHKDPSKTIWRPGEWLHQKRPAADSVLLQQRGNPFSSTGYGVVTPPVPVERSVLPAEELANQENVLTLQSDAGLALVAASARERIERNPQLFSDDIELSNEALRTGILQSAEALRGVALQEEYVTREYPGVPVEIGSSPLYSSNLQQTMVLSQTSATSLTPCLQTLPEASLAQMLREGPKKGEAAAS